MSTLIGLVGSAGAGKDSFARRLVEGHGYRRFAFADQMRELLLVLDPLVTDSLSLSRLVNHYGWDVTKRTYPEVRRLLQVFGTEVVRDGLGKDTWVNAAHSKIQPLLSHGTSVVVTDVRFENEVRLIRNLGGDIVRITRHEADDATDGHISENEWRTTQPDWIFQNNHAVSDLHGWADFLVSRKSAA
jgi:hypothetical protein